MNSQYERVAAAIDYLQQNFKSQPSLEEVAEHVHLSPFYFQRLFHEWAGTSPKKFLQYISLTHAKTLLKDQHMSLFDAALETGLSGSSRLHDLFVTIEGMTPGDYKNGGELLTIRYSFSETPFGEVMVASTNRGICHMAFYQDQDTALHDLQNQFPNASYQNSVDEHHLNALLIFRKNWAELKSIKLHLKGSDFQLKVWETLLSIPMGQLSTYGEIANQVDKPKAARAVGTAIGQNPVAFLIPCHRVIQASGALGGYHWGMSRKVAMIGWEAAATDTEVN